jgi:plasmid maintenance system antidote protein VapI
VDLPGQHELFRFPFSEIRVTGTSSTATRALLGTSAELWLGLQTEYDLRVARRDLAGSLEKRIVPFRSPAVGYDATATDASHVREKMSAYRSVRTAPRTRERSGSWHTLGR